MEVLEHHQGRPGRPVAAHQLDRRPHPLVDGALTVAEHRQVVLGQPAGADGVEEQLEGTTDGVGVGLAGQDVGARRHGADQLLHQPRLADAGFAGDEGHDRS